MNRKQVIMILSVLAVVLVVFAACGKKNKGSENTEPVVTVTDAAGQVYEQVTEVMSEVETVTKEDGSPEISTAIVTEVVTDKKGEQVTKKDGTPEVKSEIVSEVITEVVTEVVTATVPYTPPETTKKGETTTAAPATQPEVDTQLWNGDGTEATSGSSGSSGSGSSGSGSSGSGSSGSGSAASVVPVDEPTNSSGNLTSSRLSRVFAPAKANGNQLMVKLNVAADEMAEMGGASTMSYSFYTKGDKVAVEMAVPGVAGMGALSSIGTVRFILNGNKAIINFGTLYNYTTTVSEAEDLGMNLDLFENFSAEDMDYQGTTKVTKNGKTYWCETYSKDNTKSMYYFTDNGTLVRIEIVDGSGAPTVVDVVSYGYNVNDKEFEAKGKTMTEEQLESLFGSLAQ